MENKGSKKVQDSYDTVKKCYNCDEKDLEDGIKCHRCNKQYCQLCKEDGNYIIASFCGTEYYCEEYCYKKHLKQCKHCVLMGSF